VGIPRKKKIVVTNLLGTQYIEVADSLPDYQIISITDKNRLIPQNADLYVSWIKFSGHSIDHKMKKVGGDKYVRIKGGLGEIIEQIRKRI
jgi:hypothetical protein